MNHTAIACTLADSKRSPASEPSPALVLGEFHIAKLAAEDLDAVRALIQRNLAVFAETSAVLISSFRRLERLAETYLPPERSSALFVAKRQGEHSSETLACVGLGLMHVAGQGSIAWALGRLPAATASVVVLVQPVVAAILGWMLFAEALGPVQALGAGIALAGVVLAQMASRPKAIA